MPNRLNNAALLQLRSRLKLAFSGSFRSPEWGAPAAMSKALKEVKKSFDPTHVLLNERSIARTLIAFRTSGRLPTFTDLKYACFGLAQRVGRDDWCLIEDAKLFRVLLKQVAVQKDQPRRLRKCFQGLMHSYFDYPVFDQRAEAGLDNWKLLRKYLFETVESLSYEPNSAHWLDTLSHHKNLLTDKPCERYALALSKGDAKELVAVSNGIGLSANSWVWQEATAAQTQAVVQLEDDAFKAHLGSLLSILNGAGEVKLSDSVVIRCLAQVLIRYAKCSDRPENQVLRDLAVNKIGNPWLKRAAWDAYVKVDNARKMVDGWLKRRLITDFFALLSEDGAANPRRLDYWLRFEPAIEDMWFVLGANAQSNRSTDFNFMKKRMEDRLHYLGSGTTADNNAFVMRIGKFMVVEFGVTGNACFVFNAGDMEINPASKTLRIGQLKGTNYVTRLLHSGPWEQNFDTWLCPRIEWKPGQSVDKKPKASSPVRKVAPKITTNASGISAKYFSMDVFLIFLNQHHLKYEDMRSKGGALWVLTDNVEIDVSEQLQRWGFKYKPPRGWWRE